MTTIKCMTSKTQTEKCQQGMRHRWRRAALAGGALLLLGYALTLSPGVWPQLPPLHHDPRGAPRPPPPADNNEPPRHAPAAPPTAHAAAGDARHLAEVTAARPRADSPGAEAAPREQRGAPEAPEAPALQPQQAPPAVANRFMATRLEQMRRLWLEAALPRAAAAAARRRVLLFPGLVHGI